MTQPAQPSAPGPAGGPAIGGQYAGAGARLVAYLIDGLITGVGMLVVTLVLGTLIGLAGSAGRDLIVGLGIVLWFLVFLVIWLLYFPYFWARGQTPGMRVMHIRVVREEDGTTIDMVAGFVRLFGYFVSALVFYLGFLWILVDSRRRGWHDMIAGTIVVRA
jgi:uncharacterized RDD family membrane protein YckC